MLSPLLGRSPSSSIFRQINNSSDSDEKQCYDNSDIKGYVAPFDNALMLLLRDVGKALFDVTHVDERSCPKRERYRGDEDSRQYEILPLHVNHQQGLVRRANRGAPCPNTPQQILSKSLRPRPRLGLREELGV